MFFLKKKSLGIKKNNLVFIENFLDPITKKEILSKGYKYEMFKVHHNVNKLTTDLKKTYKIYFKVLKKIETQIKNSTSKKISSKVINLIFSKWLLHYISITLYKYKVLSKIKKKYPEFGVVQIKNKNLSDEDKNLLTPDTTILFYKHTHDIAKILGAGSVQITLSSLSELVKFVPANKSIMGRNKYKPTLYIKFVLSKISILISKFFFGRTIYLHDETFNFLNIWKLILNSGFRFSYLFFIEDKIYNIKKEKVPISLKKIKPDNTLEKILFENFLKYVPKSIPELLNYYSDTKNVKSKKFKNLIVSKRFFGTGHIKFVKFLIKNINNSILLSYQHGGVYGHEKYFIPEESEKMSSDYFISWGWKNKKVFPLPMNKSNLVYKKNKRKRYCLFVTWSPTYAYLSYGNNAEALPKFSMKPTYELLKSISKKNNTILRLPPYHWRNQQLWRDLEFFSQIKKIKIDDHKKNFENMAINSKFVIINHLNTTALQTLSMNIPTLIYCDKNLIEYNNIASKFLKKLRKEKIFFYNHYELFNFLKKNKFDLNNWWYKKKTQSTINDFCKYYCLRKDNWHEDWILKLNSINKP